MGMPPATAQPPKAGCDLQISLLTCDTGQDLYAAFGHSALRIRDGQGDDYVFNYGTFDTDTPHFYWKFTRGRLLYSLSVSDFQTFMLEYRYEKRKVTEQLLQLSCAEKQAIWDFLRTNYAPENRYYKYDFLYDNCSTRIRDIFTRVLGAPWKVPEIVPEPGLSFREIINRYLKEKPWEKLGINLMFGPRTDGAMTSDQIMFLPDYLEEGLGRSTYQGQPLVTSTRVVYDPGPQPIKPYPFYLHPLAWMILLAIFVLGVSFSRPTHGTQRLAGWIDRCLFFLTGLLGCFLLFMWWGTDHRVCAWNMNLLWAFPLNLPFSFYAYKATRSVRRYSLWVFLANILLLLGWFVFPQQLPLEALPWVAMLAARAWRIFSRGTRSLHLQNR
jgi:hypothetical protein